MEIATDVQAILDCLPDPAILLSRDYRILMANQAYRDIYGDGTPLRRRHCYEVSHHYSVPCDLAGEHCPLKETLETGQASKVLHVHHTPRGQEYVNVYAGSTAETEPTVAARVASVADPDISSNGAGERELAVVGG